MFLCVFNQRGETETREFLHTLAQAVPTPPHPSTTGPLWTLRPPLTQEHTVYVYINLVLLVKRGLTQISAGDLDHFAKGGGNNSRVHKACCASCPSSLWSTLVQCRKLPLKDVITPLVVSFIIKNKKTRCAYNSCSEVIKMKLKSDTGSVSSLSGQDVILHPNCTRKVEYCCYM